MRKKTDDTNKAASGSYLQGWFPGWGGWGGWYGGGQQPSQEQMQQLQTELEGFSENDPDDMGTSDFNEQDEAFGENL